MVSQEPVRILRIIARLNIGGPAIQAVTLSARLPKDAYQTLLVCGKVSDHEGDMSYLGESEGIRPWILPGLGREISPAMDLESLLQLRRVIRDFQPHIVHTHTAKAGTLGRLAAISVNLPRGARKRAKLVHTFHGHVFQGYFGPWKSFVFIQIERCLARLTDRIIVISPLQQFDICQRFRIAAPHRVQVIPLGFDLEAFRESRNRRKAARARFLPGVGEEVPVLAIIGRLTAIKNHSMLFESASLLKDRALGNSFRILVVGDGELRESLVRHAQNLGMEGQVVFAGWQKDMPFVYGAADVVALTSLNEGTPVALIEAMAAGVPVIATEVGGVADLLGGGERTGEGYRVAERGVLVHSRDALGLAQGIVFLLQQGRQVERIRSRAQDYVFSRYTVDRLIKDMDGLYGRLLFRKSAGSRQ